MLAGCQPAPPDYEFRCSRRCPTYPVHGGQQSLDLNDEAAGVINQDIATTSGQVYQLAFYLSGFPGTDCSSTNQKTLQVTAGSVSQTFIFTPDIAASPLGNQQFMLETLAFTAASATTHLTFASFTAGCAGPIIDDVSVTIGPTGAISGTVYLNQAAPANVVQSAVVEVCSNGSCAVTSSGADGQYRMGNLAAGTYDVTVLPPLGAQYFSGSAGSVTLATNSSTASGRDALLRGPRPFPAGLSIPGRFTINGIPVHFWLDPIHVEINAPPGSTVTVKITDLQGTVLDQGTLPDLGPAPSGSVTPFHVSNHGNNSYDTYGATYPPPYPSHGSLDYEFDCSCEPPSPPPPGGIDARTPNDPSGTVVNQDGIPIPGATVTLLRADSAIGPFAALPSGSNQLAWYSPTNPETSDAQGGYGWDVYPGYYQVQASAPHCAAPGNPGQPAVLSDIKQVPPAVTGLTLTLQCTQVAATLAITSPDTQGTAVGFAATLTESGAGSLAGRNVTFTATPSGGGTPIIRTVVTDSNGAAKVNLTLAMGTYAVAANFAGDGNHLAASASQARLSVATPNALPPPEPSVQPQGGAPNTLPNPRTVGPTQGGPPNPLPPLR